MLLSQHVERFTDFARAHLNGDATNDYYINLKLDHSLRVLDDAQSILREEGITGHVAELTILSALYHDIGRFPQFARYGTFKDIDSVNHGRMGVLTLRTMELPSGISKDDCRLVRAAVGLHNTMTINPRTSQPLDTMVNITRDADKIDIFSVILTHLSQEDESNKVVIHNLEKHPEKYSREIYETTFAGGCCDYNLLRYTNDFILLLVAWLFNLNYNSSARLLSHRGLIEHAFSLLPKNDEILILKEKVNTFLRYNE